MKRIQTHRKFDLQICKLGLQLSLLFVSATFQEQLDWRIPPSMFPSTSNGLQLADCNIHFPKAHVLCLQDGPLR